MQVTMPDRRGLSFAPFHTLSADELRREEGYWWNVVQSDAPMATIETAERHRQRCLEFLREGCQP
jgi:hypothetical protein